jgi:hypothetical protein
VAGYSYAATDRLNTGLRIRSSHGDRFPELDNTTDAVLLRLS